MEYCPQTINGHFYCFSNQFQSLKYCPKIIGGNFSCSDNQIKNYIYFPEKICGVIKLNDGKGKGYSFEEAYQIHLKDKVEYEKQFLNGFEKNNNLFKI